jgi:hypothetical protein
MHESVASRADIRQVTLELASTLANLYVHPSAPKRVSLASSVPPVLRHPTMSFLKMPASVATQQPPKSLNSVSILWLLMQRGVAS